MKKHSRIFIAFFSLVIIVAFACQTLPDLSQLGTTPTPTTTIIPTPTETPTPLPPPPVQPGEDNPNEPVFISGDIPYTSPFFLNGISEPFVMLEDQAGFVDRNIEFEFSLVGQAIGPVEILEDESLRYYLSLPTVPQGTMVDVDNNGQEDAGVTVFSIAYWSNTWGGPFLEPRDGTGWSTAYASTVTDSELDNEIIGGKLIVWAPDDQQSFPIGFGEDGLLFTLDDPIAPIPAGYNIVDLDHEPFINHKEPQPQIDLIEGEVALNDYSDMSYTDAFETMFEKVSREYPFTEEKDIDWDSLHQEFAPRVASADSGDEYYRALRDFTYRIPDAHVGINFHPDVFYEEQGGSFGLVLKELSDGRVIVIEVLPNTKGADEGIQVGAEILTWGGEPVLEALSAVEPYLGPYSTEHHKRVEQPIFLTRMPPGTRVSVSYQNPEDSEPREVTMSADVDYESLFAALPFFNLDELIMPVEGEVLDDSGLGYIRVTTFSDDYHLMASIWETYIEELIENEIPGLIIDLRFNTGGSGGLAIDFAGYFFDEEILLGRSSYYNNLTGEFEYTDYPARIKPGPMLYENPIAVLVSPSCISACEGFANALSQGGRSTIIGHYPSAGAFGEVGRGQYKLPEELEMQFPTGRPETIDGQVLIEGQGVPLDITVTVTEESALGIVDSILQTAVETLLDKIE
jgi:C-terminal processing protease CtpA/Prc